MKKIKNQKQTNKMLSNVNSDLGTPANKIQDSVKFEFQIQQLIF